MRRALEFLPDTQECPPRPPPGGRRVAKPLQQTAPASTRCLLLITEADVMGETMSTPPTAAAAGAGTGLSTPGCRTRAVSAGSFHPLKWKKFLRPGEEQMWRKHAEYPRDQKNVPQLRKAAAGLATTQMPSTARCSDPSVERCSQGGVEAGFHNGG